MTTKLFQGHSPVNAKLQFPKRPTHNEEFVHFGIQPNPLGSTTQPAPSKESKTPREGVPMDGVGSRREFSRLSSVEIVQSTLESLHCRVPAHPTVNRARREQNCQLSHCFCLPSVTMQDGSPSISVLQTNILS